MERYKNKIIHSYSTNNDSGVKVTGAFGKSAELFFEKPYHSPCPGVKQTIQTILI
jgi:hypothetical protein